MRNFDRHFSSPKEALDWFILIARPGLGLKRWLILGFFGVAAMSAGMAVLLTGPTEQSLNEAFKAATLSASISPVVRGGGLIFSGAIFAVTAAYMFYHRIAIGARYTQGGRGIVESLTVRRTRATGPRVVVIGGGTGLSTALKGLKLITDNLTAVVTVSDDGGSSGRLRRELGIAPPGDARQCLIALSESEPLMQRALDYRFPGRGSLGGHSLGNLLIAGLAHTEGSFDAALHAAASILAVRGTVIPSTLEQEVLLCVRSTDGQVLSGESTIGQSGVHVDQMWLEPNDAQANPAALEAISSADIIVVGPGSLYTSILPNFLVHGLADAVRAAAAPSLLICNIATQRGETDGLSTLDHLKEFVSHSGLEPSYFLVNQRVMPLKPHFKQTALEPNLTTAIVPEGIRIILRDLVDQAAPSHHDPLELSRAVQELAKKKP